MPKSKIIIVDQNDNIIGYKERDDSNTTDIYRVSALWITNSKGKILLAKRSQKKLHYPGKWGPAVTGTNEQGETYESNILKETEEELGLKDIKPQLGPKILTDKGFPHQTQWFVLNIDKKIEEFKIDPDEVEEVKWFPIEEYKKQQAEHPEEFLINMKRYSDLFI
jgi:isopentenyl-diphosphate Delta-isomerase